MSEEAACGLLVGVRATRTGGHMDPPAALEHCARERSGSADDQHRTGSVVGDLVRHRAQQKALGAGHPLVSHNDQIGLPFRVVIDSSRRLRPGETA
jgi:hypothetical protein